MHWNWNERKLCIMSEAIETWCLSDGTCWPRRRIGDGSYRLHEKGWPRKSYQNINVITVRYLLWDKQIRRHNLRPKFRFYMVCLLFESYRLCKQLFHRKNSHRHSHPVYFNTWNEKKNTKQSGIISVTSLKYRHKRFHTQTHTHTHSLLFPRTEPQGKEIKLPQKREIYTRMRWA